MHVKNLVAKTLSALILALTTSIACAEPEILDRIVVVVDKAVITQSELDARMETIKMRAIAANMRLPAEDVLQKQVLDQLISETLQLNMASRYGIEVSDNDVNMAVEDILKKQKLNEAQLEQELAKEGMSLNEFRQSIRRDMKIGNVSQGIVRGRIRISEQEISNFLNSADAQFWVSPDYRLGHILIALPPAPEKEQVAAAEAKAQRIFEKLKAGANFEEMAIAESSGPAALKGGDLGYRKTAALPTLFAEIAPKLSIGEVAAPARSQAGFHILKLKDKRGETKQIVSQFKVRHILIEQTALMTDPKILKKLNELRQQIQDGADFAKLAKEYSDDMGSKLQGGELGWNTTDTYVPEFAKAIHEAKLGEVTAPFKSPFGYHILEVTDRRLEDLTEEAIRAKARQVLTSRRMEDELQVWLQEMRDDAFIEFKI